MALRIFIFVIFALAFIAVLTQAKAKLAEMSLNRTSPVEQTQTWSGIITVNTAEDAAVQITTHLQAASDYIDSNVDDVKVEQLTPPNPHPKDRTFPIALNFSKPNGEYILEIKTLLNGEHVATIYKRFHITKGYVFDGNSETDVLSKLFIYQNIRQDLQSLTPEQNTYFDAHFPDALKARQQLSQ